MNHPNKRQHRQANIMCFLQLDLNTNSSHIFQRDLEPHLGGTALSTRSAWWATERRNEVDEVFFLGARDMIHQTVSMAIYIYII